MAEIKFGEEMARMISDLLEDRSLLLGTVHIIPRGLAGVVEGFDIMKRGKVMISIIFT